MGIFTLVGYQFGHEIEEHVVDIRGVGPWIGFVVPIGLGAYIFWKYMQRQRFLHQLTIARITPEEVKRKLDVGEDILILDLRDAFECEMDPRTIPGAFHLSVEELEEQHQKIPRGREIVLFCT